jgi:hypothetical protein
MIQQVNLYRHLGEQKQAKPALNSYLYGSALFILILLGLSIYSYINMKQTKNSLQQARLDIQNTETQVTTLHAQYPKQQLNTGITQKISLKQKILGDLSQIIHLLSNKESDQTQGFSRYFSALARQSIADVWLSGIHINADQQNLVLKGSTFYPGKTPLFLQNLQNEAVFKGKSFAKLEMMQAEKNDSQINFTISTFVEETDTVEQKSHD